MTRHNVRYWLLGTLAFLTCSLTPFSFAGGPDPLATTQNLTRYCPPINKIYKSRSNHWGTADGSFRNFETSLATKLSKFLGAQWQGATLGHVNCVYAPSDPSLFYVTLLYNKLTYEPLTKNTQWTKQKHNSLLNCHSNDPKDCPFIIRPKPKKVDLYKAAEQLREESNPYDSPAF